MKLEKITEWLDGTLRVADFDDVSNNGLQIDRRAGDVSCVAFAVDASVRAVEAAHAACAQLLVVHHGISWGGGIRRLTGGVARVVRAAIESDLALYASHLPLDAHPTLGNNAQFARLLGLRQLRPAFRYHGSVIGLIGRMSTRSAATSDATVARVRSELERAFGERRALTVGVCSGGAGDFAEEARHLGCDAFVTGEATWGSVIAAENVGIPLVCAGHYETEVYGVRALSKAMAKSLSVLTVDMTGVVDG